MKKRKKTMVAAVLIFGAAVIIFLFWYFMKSDTKPVQSGASADAAEEIPSVSADAQGMEESDSDFEVSREEQQEEITILFTGDIMPSDAVLSCYDSQGITGVVSKQLLAQMQEADITMVNEEFPFSTRGTQAPDKQFTFRINPSYVSMFSDMGIDIVTIANNHSLDYGAQALEDTFATLDEAGILYVGAGDTYERAKQMETIETGGKTIGFLAASRVIPVASWNVENSTPGLFCTYDSTALTEQIEACSQQCDYLVVYVHWGIERSETPEEYQRTLAQAYIDAGADAVIGSHPHVLQGIEYYKEKPIVYSLGNFIFYEEIAQTMAVKLTLSDEGTKLTVLPAYAQGACTQLADEETAEATYDYLESISYDVLIDEEGLVCPMVVCQ